MSRLLVDASSSPQIIPVVSPVSADPANSGRVRNLPCSPASKPPQLEKLSDGSYAVRAEWARKGWVLLQSLYEAEDNTEGWAKYERYLKAWQTGTARVSFPVDALPVEVQRRMSMAMADAEFGGEFASKVKPTTGAASKSKTKSADAA